MAGRDRSAGERARGRLARRPRLLARASHVLCVLLILVAAPLGGGAANAGQALVVDAAEYPWSAIGRINTAGRGFCTGFLVGPRAVLTAAHCLYNLPGGYWYHPEDVHFVAGYQRDRYLAHSRASAIARAAAFHPEAGPDLELSLDDWAVVTLAEPVGRAVGWLGLQRFDAALLSRVRSGAASVLQAGYRRERSHALSVSFGCAVPGLLAGGRGLVHDCAVTEGGSGSPLLVVNGNGLRVLGLHTLRTNGGDGAAYAAVLSASAFDPEWGSREAVAAGQAAGLSWGRGTEPMADGAVRGEPRHTVAQLLTRLGYLGGAKGDDRRAAIKAFESAHGLPVTGEASLALLGRLAAGLR